MKRLLCLAFGFAVACRPPQTDQAASPVLADSADMIIMGMKTSITTPEGVLVSRVFGDSAWSYEQSKTFELKRMRVVFTDSLGRVKSTIMSKKGTITTDANQTLNARDSVVATTPGGDSLWTSHFVWDNVSNMITSDTAFVFKSPDRSRPGAFTTMRGAHFIATPDFKSIQIQDPRARQHAAAAKSAPKGRKPATPAKPTPAPEKKR